MALFACALWALLASAALAGPAYQNSYVMQQPPKLPPPPPPPRDQPKIDCLVNFSPFSECSASCGGGVQSRTGQIVQSAANGGRPCPPASALFEQQPCNQIPCPTIPTTTLPPKIDCIVNFPPFSQCSVSCGGGVKSRTGQIVQNAANGGLPCPPLFEQKPCRQFPCPTVPTTTAPPKIDCLVNFPPFSQCSASCGGGVQSRTGQIVQNAANGGRPCPPASALFEQKPCNQIPCPTIPTTTLPPRIDCIVNFPPFSQCSVSCGGGVKSRNGQIVQNAANGGQPCPPLFEQKPCRQFACPTIPTTTTYQTTVAYTTQPPQREQPRIDCIVNFPPFSQCSASCGGGTQSRTGQIIQQAANGGLPCPPPSKLFEQHQCNLFPCPTTPTTPVPTTTAYQQPNYNGVPQLLPALDHPIQPLSEQVVHRFPKQITPEQPSFTLPPTAAADPAVPQQPSADFNSFPQQPIAQPFASQPVQFNPLQPNNIQPIPTFVQPSLGTHQFGGPLNAPPTAASAGFGSQQSFGGAFGGSSSSFGQLNQPQFSSPSSFLAGVGAERPACAMLADGDYKSGQCNNNYFSCVGGEIIERKCGEGQVFDELTDACELPERTQTCTGTPPTPAAPTTPLVTSPAPISPVQCPKQDIAIANPTNACSDVFYMCSNGFGVEQHCPTGLVFDASIQACDMKEFVCEGKPRTSPTPFHQNDAFTTPVPEFPCKGKADGSYADPSQKCSDHFFVCSGGVSSKQLCPGKLRFDADSGLCMREPDVFACTGHVRPTNPPRIQKPDEHVTFPPVPVDCKSHDGDFADPQQPCSNTYYSCFGGVGVERHCPAKTFFDSAMQMCDDASLVPACSGVPRPAIDASNSPLQFPSNNAALPQPFPVNNALPQPFPVNNALPRPFPVEPAAPFHP